MYSRVIMYSLQLRYVCAHIHTYRKYTHTHRNMTFLQLAPSCSSAVSLVARTAKNLPVMQETWVRSLSQEDPLKKGMATHSGILAWEIPWTEEPGGLQSTGSQESQLSMHTHSAARKGLQFSSEYHRWLSSLQLGSSLPVWGPGLSPATSTECNTAALEWTLPNSDNHHRLIFPTDWTPTLMLDDTAGTLLRLEVLLPSPTLSGSLEISWGPTAPKRFFHRHLSFHLIFQYQIPFAYSLVSQRKCWVAIMSHTGPGCQERDKGRRKRGEKTGSFTRKNCKT